MKINLNNYANVWFTSDWHLGHNKEFLYGPRNCSSRDEYVKYMIEMINSQAGPDDLIIHIGDMALTCTYEEMLEWLGAIKCKNIMTIIGNHDNRVLRLRDDLNGIERDDVLAMMETKNIFNVLGQYCEMVIVEPQQDLGVKAIHRNITLCHFPLQIWNKSQHGAWHLCGHSHGSFPETSVYNKTSKRFDCGVESALNWSGNDAVMFHYDDVKYIMNQKQIYIGDHHNEKTT